MDIRVFSSNIDEAKIQEIAEEFYGSTVKGVIDIEKEVVALGGEYHVDAQVVLVEGGSLPENVWGFNLSTDAEKPLNERIEFISLINIRLSLKNAGMEIQNPEIREKIKSIIEKLIENEQ